MKTKSTKLLLILMLPLTAALLASAATPVTDPGDAAAMRALSKSINAESALGWSSSASPCSWDLVTCDANGRVTAVQIGNKSLSGALPPSSSLSALTSLTRLELYSNRLTGPLPSSLGNLTSLTTLLLHNNLFTSLPASLFASLPSLSAVSLDNNPFTPWPIPRTLTSCSGLVNFSANSANVTGTLPEFLATSFPSLSHLGLAFNLLTGPIPFAFSSSSIRSLWLNNQDLSGELDFLSGISSLEAAWLHSNHFNGPLPDFTNLTNLRDLQLRDNQLTGPVPPSLTSLTLDRLTLTNNLLQGAPPVFKHKIGVLDLVPTTESFCVESPGGDCDPRVDKLISVAKSFRYPARLAASWKGNDPCTGWLGITCDDAGNITVINLQRMGLNGTVPAELSSISSLQRILLSGNNLTGTVPASLADLPFLKELDLSSNNLYGTVPVFAASVQVNIAGNSNIGKNTITPPSSTPASGGAASGSSSAGSSNVPKSKSSSVGVAVGSVVAAICAASLAALGFLYYRRRQRHQRGEQIPNMTVIHPRLSGSDPDAIKITVTGPSASVIMAAPATAAPSNVHMVEAGNMVISIQVLRNVTNNFSEANILGRGGFGTVYKGELHDGTKIAVKRMESGVVSAKALTEFKSEISTLTKLRHRNLVSLLGYCLEGDERLLVYEYMPQGTLSRHLFEWREEGIRPMEWKTRLGIALDVARGVEYLHSLANQSFIHRDLKPSNILLGDDMKAKVADFGLVRLAPDGKGCSVETRLAGTFGYLAPEYAVTGRVTTKVDVFSFGVILMELITGRKALDETQPEESVHLVTWFRRMQVNKDEKTLRKSIIDPALSVDTADEETLASITTVAELAGHCCAREPHQRPDMGHAVNVLASLAELWKPSDPDSEDSYGIDLDMTLPQALKKWQGMDGATSSGPSFLDGDNTYTSIPTRPTGFADTFRSADGR